MYLNTASNQKDQAKTRPSQRRENHYSEGRNDENRHTRDNIWRPWTKATEHSPRFQPYPGTTNHNGTSRQSLLSTFKHPVRLYWTKRAYDYMYEAGESLLRNFPVQATIQIVEDTDSEDSEDEDEELYDEEDTKNEEQK